MTTTERPHDTERARRLAVLRAELLTEALRAAPVPRDAEVERPRRLGPKWWEFFAMPHA